MTLADEVWSLVFGTNAVDPAALREERATRHFASFDASRFRQLVDVPDLDAFLRTDAAAIPRVSMANGGQAGSAAVDDSEYAEEGGQVDLPRLFRQFDGGSTLVVSQFHEMHEPLARFCRGLERIFLHGVQSNLYLTPAGAQGFHAHYDTHDVLVLQVRGEKHWKIWPGQPFADPTRRTPWQRGAVSPEGEPEIVKMRPGDVSYVPRGVFHEAVAQKGGGEPSLHITIGLLQMGWADALRAAVDAMEADEPLLREAFPTWRLGEETAVGDLSASAARRTPVLSGADAVQRVMMAMLDRLASDRIVMPGRSLLTKPPGLGDRLRLADTVHHHVVPTAGGAVLRWSGGREPISAEELGWLAQLEDGATAQELGGKQALAFCRRLAALGLVEPASAPDRRAAAE